MGIVHRPSRSRSDGTSGSPSFVDASRPVLCGGAECGLWDGKRLVYTVEEAADRLHIGRTLAYQQTKLYLRTGGRDGIPAINVSGLVRVPVPGLLVYAFTGRAVSPDELEELVNDLLGRSNPRRATSAIDGHKDSADSKPPSRIRRSSGRRRAASAEQLRLLPGE